MTRKDYKAFAEILKKVKDAEDRNEPVCALWLCQVIAHLFKKDNEKFSGMLFSKAIGYTYNITR